MKSSHSLLNKINIAQSSFEIPDYSVRIISFSQKLLKSSLENFHSITSNKDLPVLKDRPIYKFKEIKATKEKGEERKKKKDSE